MQTKHLVIASVAGSLVAGAAVGYFAADKKAQLKWRAISEEEILSVKKQYNMVFDPEGYSDEREATEADRERTHDYLERLDKLQYSSYSEPEVASSVEATPSFAVVPEAAEDAGVEEPTPAKPNFDEAYPYPITQEEYHRDEEEYDKLSLTYYKGDDTIADSRDDVVNNPEALLGKCHKKFMGFDPVDPHVVYVRNHNMKADYEVLLETEAFITVVHGISTEPMR